jgi:hypothetical protein
VWNMIKGLDEQFGQVAMIMPVLMPFPSFL